MDGENKKGEEKLIYLKKFCLIEFYHPSSAVTSKIEFQIFERIVKFKNLTKNINKIHKETLQNSVLILT